MSGVRLGQACSSYQAATATEFSLQRPPAQLRGPSLSVGLGHTPHQL